MEWISVKDELPKIGKLVLTIRCGIYVIDLIGSKKWLIDQSDAEFSSYPVTHWMPLPDPPG